jgi:threonine/homoserine/homoserine lactone efflux protein
MKDSLLVVDILIFLASAVLISLSGVMAPGALTAATIAQGTRSKNAGALIAIGHAVIEIPLIFLLILGFDVFLKSVNIRIFIGIAGGLFLLWMGIQMLRGLRKAEYSIAGSHKTGPVLTGFILSVSNPYFLLWWATVGLNLALKAQALGALALVLFAVVHWLCDLVWLYLLAWASFKGSVLLGSGNRKIVFGVCGAVLLLFGVKFVYDAARLMSALGQ